MPVTHVCSRCGGKKKLTFYKVVRLEEVECPECEGTGKVTEKTFEEKKADGETKKED